MQSLFGSPTRDLFIILRTALALQNSKYSLAKMNVSFKPYSRPEVIQKVDIGLPLMIYSLLPIVLSTMPDFQTILEEKDTKVSTLSFLMGCSEGSYWLVLFIVPLILSIFPFLAYSYMMSYLAGITGSSFSIIFLFCFLFIISHIFFMFFIMTFMKNAKQGRALVVVTIVFIVFFAYLHRFFTLDSNNTSHLAKHIFSLIPTSTFQLILGSMYKLYRESMEIITWKSLYLDTNYPLYIGLNWLIFDTFLYFFLFIIFNAINKRQFGSPPFLLKDLFNLSSWKKLILKKIPKLIEYNDILLSVKNLTKIYDGIQTFKALDDVTFEIQKGEVIVIIGPNGAGKSTMINSVTGSIVPTSGTLSILGNLPTSRFNELQNYLGICFQDNVLISYLTVREHFYYFGTFRGLSNINILESIEQFSISLEMNHMLDSFSKDLSGGQKRKLCIALSLLGNPPLVVMDEPTAGVDVQSRQIIWKTIASLKETTTIVTSHALEEAEAVCSRLFIMSKGKLAFTGSPNELRKEYKCGYLLRVDLNNNSIENILEFVKSIIPQAHIINERNDTISLPVVEEIPLFFKKFIEIKEKLGIISFSFTVEQIEDMLIKMIQNDEASFQRLEK